MHSIESTDTPQNEYSRVHSWSHNESMLGTSKDALGDPVFPNDFSGIPERARQSQAGIEEERLRIEVQWLKQSRQTALDRIDELEGEARVLSAEVEQLSGNLKVSEQLSSMYKHKNQTSLDILFRERSDAKRTEEGLISENEELKTRLDQSEANQAQQLEWQRLLNSIVNAHESGGPHSDPLPKRPALDPATRNGMPPWATGLFLYEAVPDQIRELNIKLLLHRARLTGKCRDFQRTLSLALQAGKSAYLLNNMPLLAKCSYYRGCAEYGLHEYHLAHVSFEEALSAKGRYIEGAWAAKWLRKMQKSSPREEELQSKEFMPTKYALAQSRQHGPNINTLPHMRSIAMPTSRWLVDEAAKTPKAMSIRGRQSMRKTRLIEAIETVAGLSDREPSPTRRAQRQLDKEDSSVLLRPETRCGNCKFYYNSILHPSDHSHLQVEADIATLLNNQKLDLSVSLDPTDSKIEKEGIQKRTLKILPRHKIQESAPPRDPSLKLVPLHFNPTARAVYRLREERQPSIEHPHERRSLVVELPEQRNRSKSLQANITSARHYDSSDKDEDNSITKFPSATKQMSSPRISRRPSSLQLVGVPSQTLSKTKDPGRFSTDPEASSVGRLFQILPNRNGEELCDHTMTNEPASKSISISSVGEHNLSPNTSLFPTHQMLPHGFDVQHSATRRSSLRSSAKPSSAPSNRRVSFSSSQVSLPTSPDVVLLSSPDTSYLSSPHTPTSALLSPATSPYKEDKQLEERQVQDSSIERNRAINLEEELCGINEGLSSPSVESSTPPYLPNRRRLYMPPKQWLRHRRPSNINIYVANANVNRADVSIAGEWPDLSTTTTWATSSAIEPQLEGRVSIVDTGSGCEGCSTEEQALLLHRLQVATTALSTDYLSESVPSLSLEEEFSPQSRPLNSLSQDSASSSPLPTTRHTSVQPSTLRHNSLSATGIPLGPRTDSPQSAPPALPTTSPAMERTRENRARSWGWATLGRLMSPALGGRFKRYSVAEVDEEGGVGMRYEGTKVECVIYDDDYGARDLEY